MDRVISSGEFLDFSQQQALLDQTNLQINRLERYKDYDQIDEVGEVSLALDLYADESCLSDPEYKHTVIIKAATSVVKESLEELFFDQLLIDNYIRPMVRYLCKYGDSPFEIVPNANRDGVAALKFMNIYNFTRVETKFGDLVGFFYQDEVQQEPTFLHPWQVMHLRLTSYENIYHPYGRGILEGGRKAFKQLRLMEDAALIYRITRAPEKRVFKIPVGQIPTKEVPQYIQAIARTFKKDRFYDPRTGMFNERYSPLIQEDDFFLPQRPDGTGPSIEKFPGAENLDAIADIEYFKKKMVAPFKIPFSRVGIGEGAGEANEKSLSSSHNEFAKAVQWVQREVTVGLTKIALCHLSMRGFSIEQLKSFQLSMSATSAIDELYRMETWGSRVGVMADLKDLGWFPKAWIVSRFTDLSPDEIQELDEMQSRLAETLDDEEEGGGLGGGLPGMGGMEDIGGEDEGLPGLDGEEAADEEEQVPGPEDEDLDELPESRSLYNMHAERKLITEMQHEDRRHEMLGYLKRLTTRDPKLRANFGYMIESGELTKLGVNDTDGDFKKCKVIVESSINKADEDEVINEYKKILGGGTSESGPQTITEEDIPS